MGPISGKKRALPSRNKSNDRYAKWAYIFLIPFFLTLLVFSLYPMLYSLILAFTNSDAYTSGLGSWLGFDNFSYLLGEHRFWQCYLNTFVIFLMNFVPQIVSALFFAVLFTDKRIRLLGKGVFKFIFFLPNIITASSVAVLFFALFQRPYGTIYEIFVTLGFWKDGFNPYLDSWTSRLIIAFIQFWMWFGNSMVIYIAGIKGINPELYESAEIDGASPCRSFFSITLPLLKPLMIYSLITSLIGGLQMFDIPQLFLNGGPSLEDGVYATETVTMYIYRLAFEDPYNYSLAAAASVFLFVVCLVLSLLLRWAMKDRKPKASRHYYEESLQKKAEAEAANASKAQ
jgi:cellobiose transport system permease protein